MGLVASVRVQALEVHRTLSAESKAAPHSWLSIAVRGWSADQKVLFGAGPCPIYNEGRRDAAIRRRRHDVFCIHSTMCTDPYPTYYL